MKPLITFDVWGTLIKSNPEFSRVRAQLILSYLMNAGVNGVDSLKIKEAIAQSKKIVDYKVEQSGVHIDREYVYKDALNMLRITPSVSDIEQIIVSVDALFFYCHPPALISDRTATLLAELSKHYTLGICSNTVLIYGNAIRAVLSQYNILQYFSPEHIKFSDEVGCSKPKQKMFFSDAIAHIGDNPVTDGACHKYGIEFIKINETNNLQSIVRQLLVDVKG